MADLAQIRADLASEHSQLDDLVAPLDEDSWSLPTPAEGWTIRDQIGHLAFFDEQATLAVDDPEGFSKALEEVVADVGAFMDRSIAKGRALSGQDLLAWWRRARLAMLEAFADVDPNVRVSWYGPAMKPASFISARIMETWAHAQDVADALGVERQPTMNLRHVAHLAVLARHWSYSANGLQAPDDRVYVELRAPDGNSWIWGSPAANSVRGDAFDFCLVTTQRRHVADTDLEVEGAAAEHWMSIAQTYAGPPGPGRQAGQFAKRGSA
ncbi:MAG: TIGR03084 family metal-binding protein [Actinomycetota bacterium]|nr:TIGR03084 family metal-binding protein [Actinomycetota bacterium]